MALRGVHYPALHMMLKKLSNSLNYPKYKNHRIVIYPCLLLGLVLGLFGLIGPNPVTAMHKGTHEARVAGLQVMQWGNFHASLASIRTPNTLSRQVLISPFPVAQATSSSVPAPTQAPIQTLVPQPLPTPASAVLPNATQVPVSDSQFTTLSPGSKLPTEDECTSRVRRSLWEPRPENTVANQYKLQPGDFTLVPWSIESNGLDINADAFRQRITGNFTGTTDEILQWGSCKWGFDEDIVRAVAVQESFWRMSTTGNKSTDASRCVAGAIPNPDCPESFGLLQIRHVHHKITYPASEKSTAFNVDYALGWRRACYEGYVDWLTQQEPDYMAGDEWGCIGFGSTGSWYDEEAQDYIEKVQAYYKEKKWAQPGF